jgi:hypothetical protein
MFQLAIGLWVCDDHPIHADMVVVAEFREFSTGKMGVVVSDDGVRHSKPVEMSVKKETTCSDLRLVIACLDPF